MSKRTLFIVLAAVVVVAVGGYAGFQRFKIYVPGIILAFTDPVSPTQPVAWAQGPATGPAPAERPPNIVLIVADDLGYNDLTVTGGGIAAGAVGTPRIDSIARDGARFVNGYSAQATCSPSRAALMTGRYPTRFGFEFTAAPVSFARTISEFARGEGLPVVYHADREAEVPPTESMGLPPEEITVAEILRARGYRTLHLGKWHLGEAPALRPEAQGFDESLGFYRGGSMYLPQSSPDVVNSKQDFDPIDQFLWANLPFAVRKNGSDSFHPDRYMTDYLAEEAAAAIAANRNRPFFLYVAFNAPHTPLQALTSDYDALASIPDHRLRVYGAMVRALDRGVGTILDALKANGLDENTLVIFTSDNGGANYVGLPDLNKPFRGWKATFFEGGIRMPFFVKWPAKIPGGTVVDGPAAHIDVLPTAVAAAGGVLPADRVIDGVDLVPFATGARQGPTRETLFWRSGHYRTLRAGDWKLQVSERPQKVWLFNLKDDPTERTNLAASNPAQVATLTAQLEALERGMAEPRWPALIEVPVRIDVPLDAPVQPTDELVYWAN